MDRLVKYLDFRMKTYGGITHTPSVSSMYYQMGPVKVRVSDHMVYGENASFSNYNFIIQENGQYIFIPNPRNNVQEKMYMKIVDYSDAKEFIKTLHDWSLNFNRLADYFAPENWNKETPKEEVKAKITWNDFYTKYLSNKTKQDKQSFCDKVEMMIHGCMQKGDVSTKLNRIQNMWDNLGTTEYSTIMDKVMDASK